MSKSKSSGSKLNTPWDVLHESAVKGIDVELGHFGQIPARAAYGLWHWHELLALEAYFGNRDLTDCKQHFYVCGRLDEYLIRTFDSDRYIVGQHRLAYALCSDNSPLINRLASCRYSRIQEKLRYGLGAYVASIQDCLLGDLVAFDQMLEQMKRRPLFGKKKPDPDFEFMFCVASWKQRRND